MANATSNNRKDVRHEAEAPAIAELRWTVRLLGAVEAHAAAPGDAQTLTRWPSRAVAGLLARLALEPARAHPREELMELLWPGVALDVGRNRLRQALSTLKSLLEPAGVTGHAVLQADRSFVRVVPGALACDARVFERLARTGHAAQALAGYGGELMPGHYDDWVQVERQRLGALHEQLSSASLSGPAAPAAATLSPVAATLSPALAPAASATRRPSGRTSADVPPDAAPDTTPPAATFGPDPPRAGSPPLPSYLTRLFGADLAAARLHALVRSHRLVTLLGPGGSGKTRLVVEVAHALRTLPPWPAAEGGSDAAAPIDFAQIAFVSLVTCLDPTQMQDALARTLQLPKAGNEGVEGVVAALAGRPVLLVLDNFEQLVDSAANVLAAWLARLPQLHVLVTSRRALGLDGENTVSAEPLPLPPADASLAMAASHAAVLLFVDRARAVRSDFHLSERNHAAVVALVRALHGLPLAIELAASRTRSFPPAEMVKLLAAGSTEALATGPHLSLLCRAGPRSGHDPRHASMTEVIAWSWRLLDSAAQQTLTALTVFAGDAPVAAVAAALGQAPAAVAARLDDLVAHSLLHPSATSLGEPRFGLLEPVREYVLACAPPAVLTAQRVRLRRWYTTWVQTQGNDRALAQVALELPTLQALLANAAADGAPQDGLNLMLAMHAYWDTDGMPARIQAALAQALATTPDIPAKLRSEAHEQLAYLRFQAGFLSEAQAHAEAALIAAGDDPSRRARALVRRAWLAIAGALRDNDPGSEHHRRLRADLEEALTLARGCADRHAQARALQQLAQLSWHADCDPTRAEALFETAQRLWEGLGDRHRAQARLRNRAQCWVALGRLDEAAATLAFCEKVAREDGDWVGQVDTAVSMGTLLAVQRQWEAALRANQRALALCWQRWHRHGLAFTLWSFPRLLARLRRPVEAMQLMGFVATFWAANFGTLSQQDRRTIRRVRGLVRAQIGPMRAEALWEAGAAMELAAAVSLATRA